jgi:GDP-L-fucose synthase
MADSTVKNNKILTPHVKIFVAGHRGLVGSAIVRQLTSEGCKNLIVKTRRILLNSSTKT